MASIEFETKLFTIRDWIILRVPEDASLKLPSRGMVYVRGTMNGQEFSAPLEPDGRGSHWFKVDKDLLNKLGVKSGDRVDVKMEVISDWPKPEVLSDLEKALLKSPAAKEMWDDITPKAQWEWTRWIRGAKQNETRDKHVEVAISKMNKGMRRPCCFNAAMCSEPYVANSKWQLTETS